MNTICQPMGEDGRSVLTADFRLPRLLKLVLVVDLVVDLVESVRAMEVEEMARAWRPYRRRTQS